MPPPHPALLLPSNTILILQIFFTLKTQHPPLRDTLVEDEWKSNKRISSLMGFKGVIFTSIKDLNFGEGTGYSSLTGYVMYALNLSSCIPRMHRYGNQEMTVKMASLNITYSKILRSFYSCQCNIELGRYGGPRALRRNVRNVS